MTSPFTKFNYDSIIHFNMKYLDHLNWRYATKIFDPEKRLTDEQVSLLRESIKLAPSSSGLQPFMVVEVTDQELKLKLREAGFDQKQYQDCDRIYVFAANKEYTKKDGEAFLIREMRDRNKSEADIACLRKSVMSKVEKFAKNNSVGHFSDQAHIALGFLLNAAAHNQIDACPMGGFDHDKYDATLGLDKKGYTSVVTCCVGFRGEGDKYATLPKVRKTIEELFDLR